MQGFLRHCTNDITGNAIREHKHLLNASIGLRDAIIPKSGFSDAQVLDRTNPNVSLSAASNLMYYCNRATRKAIPARIALIASCVQWLVY